MKKVEVILFDLGGVLIELGQPPVSDWRKWMGSAAIRDFESGQSTVDEFAAAALAEFDLPLAPGDFVDAFRRWPIGPFEGAVPMLRALSADYRLACLSNTNDLHWRRFEQDATLLGALDDHFASHLIGLLKPDPAIYRHVIDALDCDPASILFLDDNAANVTGASDAGMQALRVQGIDETKRAIAGLA